MTAAESVELTASWWMDTGGTGRVRRVRGEVLNLSPDAAARLVALGAAKPVSPAKPAPVASTPKPTPASEAPAPRQRRKATPKAEAPESE